MDSYQEYPLPAGLDPLLCDIHTAILNDDLGKLQELCEMGGAQKLNDKFTQEINPQHAGMTPLALASALNKAQIVGLLLDYGANVNLPFAQLSTTALMTSSFHGHFEVVQLLLSRGADVSAIDMQQSTALGYVFGGSRNMDVISMLLNAGVDVNQKNMLGMNALLLVSGYGDDRLVQMTLSANADPNAVNDFGHSALHLAVVGKRDQIKKMKKSGIQDAVEAEKSLNRRGLDQAIVEWAKSHPELIRGSIPEEKLMKVAQFMMSLGQKMDDTDHDDDDQEAMRKRVEAVFNHRQDKLKESRENKKPAIMNLLSCGGGKSGKTKKNTASEPFSSSGMSPNRPKPDSPVTQLSERCAVILRMLIDAGCQIDKAEKTFGMTALDMAVLNGDIESAAILVSAGADPNHLSKMFALSDLYEPLVSGRRKEVKDLLIYDDDLDLNQAFSRFNITRKGDPPHQGELDDEGQMPIAVAARINDNESIKLFLKDGANLNAVSDTGRSALCEAAVTGNVRLIDFLLSKGANPDLPNPAFKNGTAVVAATIARKPESVDALLRKGAKVDLAMTDGRTSLVKAMEARDSQLVDLLLMANLEQNFTDRNSFMYHLAEQYQSSTRDVEQILNSAAMHSREFAEQEAREQAKREAELAAKQIRAEAPPPQAQFVPQPQPRREAPANIQQEVTVREETVITAAIAQEAERAPPQPQPVAEEEESSSEEEEEPVQPQQAPPTAVRREPPAVPKKPAVKEEIPPEPRYAPPALPDSQPPPIPASGPPQDDEEESSEEETSEEEESSEEEETSEEEEEEEEEQKTVRVVQQQGQPQTVTRTVVTRTVGPQGQQIQQQQTTTTTSVQRTMVTKQTVVQNSHNANTVTIAKAEDDDDDEEEETDSEEEETDSDEESEEETDSEEESEEEEPKAQDINRNVNKPAVKPKPPPKKLNTSLETEI